MSLNTIQSFVRSFPPATQALGACALCFSLLSMLSSTCSIFFSLTPAFVISGPYLPHFWSLVSGGLVERHVVNLVVFLPVLVLASKKLETIWASHQFAIFILVVLAGTGVSSFFTMIALYSFTMHEPYIFSPVGGLCGVVGALIVGLRQIYPEQQLEIFGFNTKIGYRLLPSLYVLLCVIIRGPLHISFAVYGTYFGWVYIRFFKKNDFLHTVGDSSEDFAFAHFFPLFCRPVVNIFSTVTYKMAVCMHIISAQPSEGQSSLPLMIPGTSSSSAPVTTQSKAVSDRRRARALQALDEKLALMANQPDIPLDDDSPMHTEESITEIPPSAPVTTTV